jgi:hypothetical protein
MIKSASQGKSMEFSGVPQKLDKSSHWNLYSLCLVLQQIEPLTCTRLYKERLQFSPRCLYSMYLVPKGIDFVGALPKEKEVLQHKCLYTNVVPCGMCVVALLDVWHSWSGTFQKRTGSPMWSISSYFLCKKIGLRRSPKSTPHDWCGSTMYVASSQWKPM